MMNLEPRRVHGAESGFARSDFDRLFDELRRGLEGPMHGGTGAVVPRIDLAESDTELRLAAELPGVNEKDIEVSLEDGVLMIRGERGLDEGEGGSPGLRHRETFRGRFERALRLPSEVDAEAVTAVYRNGILTVTLPKAPEARVRTIPITGRSA